MALLMAVAGLAVQTGVALADGHGSGPVVVTSDNHQGEVTTSVSSPGRGSSHTAIVTIASSSQSSCVWIQAGIFERLPLPPVVGGKHGTWWQQYCNNNGWAGMPVWVPNATPASSILQASPATLAQRAVNRLRLPSPTVGLNPRGRALVNLPEWFWIPRSQWQALSQRTQAGPVWAQVTARPVSTTWDPGDSSAPVTCSGPGTPYDSSRPASEQSTDCSYTYTRSSADQPQSGPDPNDRFFTVTVTTTWAVSWVGVGGLGGTLPVMTRSMSFQLPVAQRESVVTGGSG
jgi:hypothetical protein